MDILHVDRLAAAMNLGSRNADEPKKAAVAYSVLVFSEDSVTIYKTTERAKMLQAVRLAAAQRRQFTVFRQAAGK